MNEALLALVSAISVLAGALLQTVLARFHARSTRRNDLLIEAYGDFLNSFAKMVAGTPNSNDAISLMIFAKQKISAYAPENVLRALEVFLKTSQRFDNPDARIALIRVVREIRVSVGLKSVDLESAIGTLLFGNDVAEHEIPRPLI